MLNTLKGDGFDCLLTLISIKMEHPRHLQVCINVCIIFAHKGARVIRVKTGKIILKKINKQFVLSFFLVSVSEYWRIKKFKKAVLSTGKMF